MPCKESYIGIYILPSQSINKASTYSYSSCTVAELFCCEKAMSDIDLQILPSRSLKPDRTIRTVGRIGKLNQIVV